ncbi:hypothetical protein AB0K60_25965 [Thermopolyspora sp. NPDC052614]|uniref:hypothetical protein n=1 Tax=Thermopolyspora sp. NPDC052614 TaxID=3155682 RepID=UPI00343FE8B2
MALTAFAAGPAQADTVRVPCPDSILQGRIPDGIDLAIIDKDKKTLCFRGQSDRAMQVNIYGVTQIYKHDNVRSVTLIVERTAGDVGTAWERIYLDANKPFHWFLGAPAHRIDSIYIQK